MKKIITLSLFLFLSFSVAKGQTPLTTAKDFKAVDVNGVVHSLFHYLDNDKMVLLMFTTIGCGSCYTSYPFVQTSFEEFGCNFGNVVTILVSNNHTYFDFLEQPFNQFGSIKIANPPGSSIVTDYSVFAYPTFVIIRPDQTIVEQDIWPITEEILRNKILEHGGTLMDCPDIETSEVAVEINPAGAGIIRGVGHHIPGNQIELEAMPNQGWIFENWTNENSQIISTSPFHNLVVPDENLQFTANFKTVTSTDNFILSPKQITVYPNPARDFVSFSVKGVTSEGQNAKFKVFDTMGRVVLYGNLVGQDSQIDISALERGVYFVRVENSLYAAKFVKE